MYFFLRTEEYFAFYRTLNRVYSIIIDLIIFNNYIDAQNIRVTDEVIFSQVTDPGLTAQGETHAFFIELLTKEALFLSITICHRSSNKKCSIVNIHIQHQT